MSIKKKKYIILIIVLIPLLFSGCSLLQLFGGFRIKNVSYYKQGSPRTIGQNNVSKVISGDVVNYDVEILYDVVDVIKVDFYWTYGQDQNSYWALTPGSGPDYRFVGSETEFDGSYIFDTSFAGLNWITVKGIAEKENGEIVEDKLWFNVDLIGPDIYVNPRNESVVKSLNSFDIAILDGGYSLGTNYKATDITLKDAAQNVVPFSNISYNENGIVTVSLLSNLKNGSYTVDVTAFDNLGNEGKKSSTFVVNSTMPSPPVITLTNPSWNGGTIHDEVKLNYSSDTPLKELYLDLSFGGRRSTPYVWGDPPSITLSPLQQGTIKIDTNFTGRNYCFFRLFGKAENGATAVSDIIVGAQIDNISY